MNILRYKWWPKILHFCVIFRINLRDAWKFIYGTCVFDSEMGGMLLGCLIKVFSVELVTLMVVLWFSYMESTVPSLCPGLRCIWNSLFVLNSSDKHLLLVTLWSNWLHRLRYHQLLRHQDLIWSILSRQVLIYLQRLTLIEFGIFSIISCLLVPILVDIWQHLFSTCVVMIFIFRINTLCNLGLLHN